MLIKVTGTEKSPLKIRRGKEIQAACVFNVTSPQWEESAVQEIALRYRQPVQ
jgi:hypothetical protein